ncbi:MAG: hypothetical protein M3O06_09580 [Pseudomonadota bacterium]|nr:hypothetical protein [Pseudomonadota bacterium]
MRALPRFSSTAFKRNSKVLPSTSDAPKRRIAVSSVIAMASGRDSASFKSPLITRSPIISAKPGSTVRLLSLRSWPFTSTVS